MLADKPTELSKIKLKTWTRQPVPMISEHSAHLTPLSVDFRTWLWRYIHINIHIHIHIHIHICICIYICIYIYIFKFGSQSLTPARAQSQYKDSLSRYGDSMPKIKGSWDRLIFTNGILTLINRLLYIKMSPASQRRRPPFTAAVASRIIRFVHDWPKLNDIKRQPSLWADQGGEDLPLGCLS